MQRTTSLGAAAETTAGEEQARARTRVRVELPSSYLPTLDGWRAIAVGLVIFSHTREHAGLLRDAGGLGVSIFFGISGFLITARLLHEWNKTGRVDLRAFYMRRAFRILPPALLYLAVVTVLGALGLFRLSPRELLGAVFFFRNYVPGGWQTSHFWSLAVEEHFYLFFPALLVLLGVARTRWAALGITVAAAIWRVVDTRTGVLTHLLPDGVYAAARTDFRLDGLMLGCLAALLLATKPRLPVWVPTAVVSLAPVALLAHQVGVFPLPQVVLASLIAAMLTASVLAAESPIGRLLELPAMRWIGRLSYGLYLWQQLFFVKYPADRSAALALVERAPGNVVALIAVCLASYYLLERPLISLGQRVTRRYSIAR